METKRMILTRLNGLLNLFLAAVLFLVGAYAVYALWDNQRIYDAADAVQADMIALKPTINRTEDGIPSADFSALLEINEDVCAWLTLDGTNIDYPVLQGKDNLSYINTDVYGNFALTGSIYLDTRNDRAFSDSYSLLYGHHMENSKMFGDLDLYKEADFFRDNATGVLILPEGAYELEILSCLVVTASDKFLFTPDYWQEDNVVLLLEYISENALYTRETLGAELLQSPQPVQLLAMSTCASEYTDARTVLVAVMTPYSADAAT